MGKLLLLTLHLSLFKELWQIKQEHLILHSDLKEGDTGLPNHAERRPPLHVNSNNLSRLQQRQKLPAFADCPYLNIAGISLSNSQYPEYKCFLFNNCISLLVCTLQQSQVTFTAHLSYPLGASLLQQFPTHSPVRQAFRPHCSPWLLEGDIWWQWPTYNPMYQPVMEFLLLDLADTRVTLTCSTFSQHCSISSHFCRKWIFARGIGSW